MEKGRSQREQAEPDTCTSNPYLGHSGTSHCACQMSKPNISGVGNILLSWGWRERDNNGPYSSIFSAFCSVSLDGQTFRRVYLQVVSPVPHLPLSLHLTPMASAITTPSRSLLSRTSTASILAKLMNVFPPSFYLPHLCCIPPSRPLPLSGIPFSFGLMTSLDPGFPTTFSECSSHLYSCPSTQWWSF